MNSRIENFKKYFVIDKKHHEKRVENHSWSQIEEFLWRTEESDQMRAALRLKAVLLTETPVVFKDEKIALMRTVKGLPSLFSPVEWKQHTEGRYVAEQGRVFNLCPDYTMLMNQGLTEKRMEIALLVDKEESNEFLKSLLLVLDSVINFTQRYIVEAKRIGNELVASNLESILEHRPETFNEALQYLRLLQYVLWCNGSYHNILGRFDQYMYPFYKKDIDNGTLTEDTALDLLEEFFLSLNRDSDLYIGMQQGDNGQSIVLGGYDKDGNDMFNDLSRLSLKASEELCLIDPKINLRVSKKSPDLYYELGSRLTRKGLGFPQYSNDDVVVEALKRWGYEEEDACDYCVAACWEFIIPGKAVDIPNIAALDFPGLFLEVFNEADDSWTFEKLKNNYEKKIRSSAAKIVKDTYDPYMEPSPYMSLMIHDCLEQRKDCSLGAKYNNYGIHGVGVSTAADSMAAVEKLVYQDKEKTISELQNILRNNYEGEDELLWRLRNEFPKFGNDGSADTWACWVLDIFASELEGKKNKLGGIYRAGTGSAMFYIAYSKDLGATPDGRKAGEELACNYSPSLNMRNKGPISIVKSVVKPDLVRVCNGGPLTIELAPSILKTDDSLKKVAQYVKFFVEKGGHQLQLNVIDKEELLDALKHPDNHKNLIVRVWGWSGYFVELDEVYQNQIIKRADMEV